MTRPLLLSLLVLATATPCLAKPQPAIPTATQQFNCDALAIDAPLDKATVRDLEPAHSLEAAAAVLARHRVHFERTRGVLTMSGLSTKALDHINALPAGEPIIFPDREGSTICVLRPSADSI